MVGIFKKTLLSTMFAAAFYGCGPGKVAGPLCMKNQGTPNTKSLHLDSEPPPSDSPFLPNWNGLSGVIAGLDANGPRFCKAFVEIVPAKDSPLPPSFYLWTKPDCRVDENPILYLAFKQGYLKTQIRRRLGTTDQKKFVVKVIDGQVVEGGNSTLNNIYKTSWPISANLSSTYGLAGTTDTFDALGHIVEEFEFLPFENSTTNDFLGVVIDHQLRQRAALIPKELETDISEFRHFFLNQRILKRQLLKYSQSSSPGEGYRYCSEGPWLTTEACQNRARQTTEKLAESLTPELWNSIKQYFYPNNASFDFNNDLAQEQIMLNSAMKNLSAQNLFHIRFPTALPAELNPETAGFRAAFSDIHFSAMKASEYGLMTSPLVLSSAPHSSGFLQLSGLQPTEFCTQSTHIHYRKPQIRNGPGFDFFLGLGSAEISIAGMVPFAAKRPRCNACGSVFGCLTATAGSISGGTSVLVLPQLNEEDALNEVVMRQTVTDARERARKASQTQQPNNTGNLPSSNTAGEASANTNTDPQPSGNAGTEPTIASSKEVSVQCLY